MLYKNHHGSIRLYSILVVLIVWSVIVGLPAKAQELPATIPGISSAATTCTPTTTRFCAGNRRFRITASWKTPDGNTGQGNAVTLTDDTGYFWFFDNDNIEVLVKVLNGCGSNNRFWVFAAGLTNVQVDLSVQDLATGQSRTYQNPLNANFAPIQDTAAFATCFANANSAPMEDVSVSPVFALTGPLNLNQGRFQVGVNWQLPQGTSGAGQPVRITDQTGYFWFFDPNNVELIIKVLDGCAVSGKYWVFSAGLTNVKTEITVKDSATGAVKIYTNPQNSAFQPILDTSAFSCSDPGGLPPDPGEEGKQTLAGIDSDRDGLRDDLQRYIYFNYQGSPATMAALRQTATGFQEAMLDSSSQNQSLDNANALVRAAECLHSAQPANSDFTETNLLAEALNTEQRLLAYLRYNDQLAGATFPLKPTDQWGTSCSAGLSGFTRNVDVLPAAACSPTRGTTVFFGNGVWNTCGEANQSAMRLESEARSVFGSADYEEISFQMACNPTRGHLEDLWRATKQRFLSDSSAFIRALGGIDLMPDFLQRELIDKADEITEAAAVADPTLQAHADTYTREIFEGRKVAVVAHSQGNFYANLAYQLLPTYYLPSFGIVSVANPDSYVAGGGPYTTLEGDLVIGAVPGSLRANTTNSVFPDIKDLSGHMFLASYMRSGSNSRAKILADLKTTVESLEPPENSAGNGVITVTLNWGEEPDVDLHVFEPDGTHVYYSQRIGSSGYLDVDDVSSFGPEHYYVACDTLAPGTYQVGVNYYAGDAPEVARVQIQAGLEVRSFQVSLPFERGGGGNDSPIPVADIIVTGDSVSGFNFTIVPQ